MNGNLEVRGARCKVLDEQMFADPDQQKARRIKAHEDLIGQESTDVFGDHITLVAVAHQGRKWTYTVQWDDGTTKDKQTLSWFRDHKCTKYTRAEAVHLSKVKEILNHPPVVQLDGQEAIVIKVGNDAKHCTVKFEDDEILENKAYCDFLKGRLYAPSFEFARQTSVNEFTIAYFLEQYGFQKAKQGSLKKYGFGRKEIDIFNKDLKIAIEYDGYYHGEAVAKKRDMEKNQIAKDNNIRMLRIRQKEVGYLNDPNCEELLLTDAHWFSPDLLNLLNTLFERIGITDRVASFDEYRDEIWQKYVETTINDRIGEKRQVHGLTLELIASRGCKDCDFKCLETDQIITHRSYSDFTHGRIHPDANHDDDIIETKNGHTYRVLATYGYHGARVDIMVDDQFVLDHQYYSAVKNGKIEPKYATEENRKAYFDGMRAAKKQKYIGETVVQNCGYTAEIVRFENKKDLTIYFKELDITRDIKSYDQFKRGGCAAIQDPYERSRSKHIGETNTMHGYTLRLIDWRASKDCDFECIETSQILEGKSYFSFTHGLIHPDENHNDETCMTIDGHTLRIINSHGRFGRRVDVIVDEKYILENQCYRHFQDGKVRPQYATEEHRNAYYKGISMSA